MVMSLRPRTDPKAGQSKLLLKKSLHMLYLTIYINYSMLIYLSLHLIGERKYKYLEEILRGALEPLTNYLDNYCDAKQY